MIIREYKAADKEKCMAIFDSNCPKFFDVSERVMFSQWLDHQADNQNGYSSPTYKSAEKDAYYVIDTPETGVIGCGGFYIVKDSDEARLAWGMIHSDVHKKGFGTALYRFREEIIRKDWPGHKISLGTSQHTFPFYQRMGLNVIATTRSGYGPDLDQYDMLK